MPEEVLSVEPKVAEGTDEIDCKRAIRRQVGGCGFAVCPEAMIEDLGHDATVRVVPAGDAGCVAGVDSVLEVRLVLVEGYPRAGGGMFERDEKAAGGDVDGVRGDPGK